MLATHDRRLRWQRTNERLTERTIERSNDWEVGTNVYRMLTTHMRPTVIRCTYANERTIGGENMANAKTYTPKELAAEIGIDPKVLRNYLRKAHTRELTAKNTSWIITAAVANDCKREFKKNVAGSAKK